MAKFANMLSLNNEFDDALYETLFKECFVPYCAFYKYKFGFSADTAKELVHIGFIRLWENRATVSPASAKAYVRKTITNACLDLLKHEKVKQKYIRYVAGTDPAEQVEAEVDKIDYTHLSADIQKAIAGLPQQMQTVFTLSRNEGLKYAEIAERLHISIKTVETQMSRALARLRQELSRYLIMSILALLLNIYINFFQIL